MNAADQWRPKTEGGRGGRGTQEETSETDGRDSDSVSWRENSRWRSGIRRLLLVLFSLALVAAHSPHQLPNDYLDFASRHADRGQPIGAKELSLALSDADATRPVRLDLDRWELRERIVQELNIDFLLDDLKHGKRAVRVERELRRNGFTERRLVFEDPEIGSFVATLLVPPGDGPHPAVLGLHGHRDDDVVFVRGAIWARIWRCVATSFSCPDFGTSIAQSGRVTSPENCLVRDSRSWVCVSTSRCWP